MQDNGSSSQLSSINQRFYDQLWAGVRLIEPSRFNSWPLISELASHCPERLELGPGMRPRLPIAGTYFADISQPALASLAAAGGICRQAPINQLPYDDNRFDLICALDIIEHVEDDRAAMAELCRVGKPGATVLLSTPLHPEYWTAFDEFVGHYRRYRPDQLATLLADNRLCVEQSAGHGMKPSASWLVDIGMQQLRQNLKISLWFYNRLLMPLGLHFQKPLLLQQGMVDLNSISDVLMVCRLNKAG